jgi:hypothetical protein
MPTFYLQFGVTDHALKQYKSGDTLLLPDERVFLDDHVSERKTHKNELIREYDAPTWLAAKDMVEDDHDIII